MAIHVALRHRTRYDYDRPVSLSPHVIRLRPAPHCRTPILSYSLGLVPKQHFINWQQDPFGNYLARVVFPEPTRQLVVDVELVAEMAVLNPFDFFLEPSAEMFPFTYDETLAKELTPFLEKLPRDSETAGVRRGGRHEAATNGGLPRRAQHAGVTRGEVHHPARAGRPDAGRDTDARFRLVSRQRLAARPGFPPPWSGGALRLGLSDSAQAGRQGARWSERHRRRLHRPSRLDRGLPARRRLDWTRIRHQGFSPARATSRSPRRRTRKAPRRCRAPSTSAK